MRKPQGMGDLPWDDFEEAPELSAVDISLCKLRHCNSVANKMRTLVEKLIENLNEGVPPEKIKALFSNILAAHAVSQSYFNWDFTDLYDFCRALRDFSLNLPGIPDMCKDVMDAIETKRGNQGEIISEGMCLISKHEGDRVENSNGVSIFFPWDNWDDNEIVKRYKDLEFLNKSKWSNFLERYLKLAAEFEKKEGIFS